MYGGAIVLMLSVSIYGELSTIYWNLVMLSEMAKYECKVKVRRNNGQGNNEFKEISSIELVPGDVFILPEGINLPCDAIMLSGESVINEAMLTGESLPSVKTGVLDNNDVCENFSIENKTQVLLHFLIL
jgi:cation-transporting ATPase 13A3/4/5